MKYQSHCKLADKTNKGEKDTYDGAGLPLHHRNEQHAFQWEQATILEIERDINRRRLLAAIHIYKNKDIAVSVYWRNPTYRRVGFLSLTSRTLLQELD